GYRVTPITTMGGFRTNSTYYEDVRVPADHLIGPQDGGWWLIVTQLNHERVSLMTVGMVQRLWEDTVAWARATELATGGRVSDKGWVQTNLARVKAGLEVLGAAGAIRDGSPDAVLHGRCERLYRGHAPILTFGGGTNEVQREIIAM